MQYYDFNERYSMLVFLPDGNTTTDLDNFIRNDFNAKLINKAYYVQEATKLQIEIPRMKFGSSMDITDVSLMTVS